MFATHRGYADYIHLINMRQLFYWITEWIVFNELYATERADLTYIRGKKFIISADLALSRHHFIHIGIHAPEFFSFTDLVLFMYYRHFPEIWLEVRSNAVALLRFRSFWKFSLHILIKKRKYVFRKLSAVSIYIII